MLKNYKKKSERKGRGNKFNVFQKKQKVNTVDSLFLSEYLIPRFSHFPSICKNIKS